MHDGRLRDYVSVLGLVHDPARRHDHLQQDLPEFVVLVAVDDEVDGGVHGGQKVGEADQGLHALVPCALHVHTW